MLRLTLVFLLALASGLRAADAPSVPAAMPKVIEVPAVKTWIYVGSVTITLAPLLLAPDGSYHARYDAKVFPFFSYNEAGKCGFAAPPDTPAKLARGEAIDFEGWGETDAGARRRFTARATPTDTRTGKFKVRIYVSPKIVLVFNSTYTFGK